MENVLIDKQVNWLAKDENQELIKDFEKIFVVGKDLKQTSFDENCASFCVDRNCDFLKKHGIEIRPSGLEQLEQQQIIQPVLRLKIPSSS